VAEHSRARKKKLLSAHFPEMDCLIYLLWTSAAAFANSWFHVLGASEAGKGSQRLKMIFQFILFHSINCLGNSKTKKDTTTKNRGFKTPIILSTLKRGRVLFVPL
jgi:hypothetical protein